MASALAKCWSRDTVAVVTGSNKGVGYEIVKGLARNGITTVLAARDVGRGEKAAAALKAEGFNSVVFHQLEVTDPESVDNLARWLKKEFGGVDILINNARFYSWDATYEGAKSSLETNYYGQKRVTNKLLPLLRTGARIVNVSSQIGQLSRLGDEFKVKKVLSSEDQLTEKLVDSFAIKYLEAVKAGRWKEEGWCAEHSRYSDSKVLLKAYTRAFSRTLESRPNDQKIFVNVVTPGYTATDLTANMRPGGKSPEEGADTMVWLSHLPDENYPNGQFFYERRLIEW